MPPAVGRLAPAIFSLLAGLAVAFAHPPFGFLPGLLGYGAIMLLIERAPKARGGFFRGWLAGTAFFTVSCWWIYEAFQVDAATYGWMAPFAVGAMAMGLGLLWGLIGLAYHLTRPAGPLRVVVFAGVFALLEWVRGWLFTGFPWNLPGETWLAGGMMSQGAAVFGAYGYSWITVFIAATPAMVVFDRPRRPAILMLSAAAAVTLAMAAYGWTRLSITAPVDADPIRVRIVQPGYQEQAVYTPQLRAEMLATYAELTARPAGPLGPAHMVFWPEGALPVPLDEMLDPASPEYAAIARALVPGQQLVLSSWRYGQASERAQVFNSLAVIEARGGGLRLVGLYDKHRLVPFGEYTPGFLRAVGFDKLVPVPGTFDTGPPPAPLDIGGRIIQPLLCYESLFPGFTRRGAQRTGKRPDLIVNLSNDGWFGVTSGPLQHLNIARYRAIEEGLPMVRSTPGGVSAVVDPYGRIMSGNRLGLGQAGVVDAELNSVQVETPYRRYGDLGLWLLMVVSAFALGAMRLARRRQA